MDLLEYTNLFSPTECKKNGKIILKYFQWWKSIAIFAINIENVKTLKCHKFKKKHYVFILFAASVVKIIKNYLKKKKDLKY